MKVTNEIVKNYEGLIHKTLKSKYNLLVHEEYEDLVQEGRRFIIEGLQNKYDPKRGSICTFLYLYLGSRFSDLNSKNKDLCSYRNMKKRRDLEDIYGNIFPTWKTRVSVSDFADVSTSSSKTLRNVQVREAINKLTENRKTILNDFFLLKKKPKEIANNLGDGWTPNRVKWEAGKLKNIFKEISE